MDWLAVRAEMAGLAVPLALAAGVLALAEPVAAGELAVAELVAAELVAAAVAEGVTSWGLSSVSGTEAPVDDPNKVLLAGTSSRNEAKILLSSGCVHRTLAVSEGTTSERGMFGIVKKAILSDGMPRSDSARL
jgi:hypothetical protein